MHSLEHSNSLDFYVVVNKESVECVFRNPIPTAKYEHHHNPHRLKPKKLNKQKE